MPRADQRRSSESALSSTPVDPTWALRRRVRLRAERCERSAFGGTACIQCSGPGGELGPVGRESLHEFRGDGVGGLVKFGVQF